MSVEGKRGERVNSRVAKLGKFLMSLLVATLLFLPLLFTLGAVRAEISIPPNPPPQQPSPPPKAPDTPVAPPQPEENEVPQNSPLLGGTNPPVISTSQPQLMMTQIGQALAVGVPLPVSIALLLGLAVVATPTKVKNKKKILNRVG